MDPLTLFALANGAVSAVKAGCKLYKDIKGAAGDVKEVLKDLDDQFNKRHKDKPPSVAEKNQYIQEKNRVIELNKKANSGDQTNIYQEIGDQLGAYYDNFYKCMAVFEEEERRAHTEVYTGDASLGKRALQRVLMKKQLEAMSKELRELMVYQSPPELGALYTEVEALMKEMGKEQKVLIAQQMKREAREKKVREARKREMTEQAIMGVTIICAMFIVAYIFMIVIDSRQTRFPELGNCPMPKGSWLYKKWTNTIWAECE
jgi:hypothetical protein